MQKLIIKALLLCFLMWGLIACGSSSSTPATPTTPDTTVDKDSDEPTFEKAKFSKPTQIDNSFFPLKPGITRIYFTQTDEGAEKTVVEVLTETKIAAGVESVVVRDQVFLDDLLIEDTHDWYAQDDDGNVWYMGEEVLNYTYDDNDEITETDSEGSWEAGKDIAETGDLAVAGTIMTAAPKVGDSYQQEYYAGIAEDMGDIVALDVEVTLNDGRRYTCLQTRDWTPLDPESEEHNYYAPGIGPVREQDPKGESIVELVGLFNTAADQIPDFNAAKFTHPTVIDNPYLPLAPGTKLTYEVKTEDGTETIVTEVLDTTRVVNGIECVVFRDQVSLDGQLIEDTHDWFAQDDDGNVWYMGEEVINYEYDDKGKLIDTNHEGAWEAGKNNARPGIMMWAAPQIENAYYQEFAEGEAEDMGMVVAQGVEVELENGNRYEDCLKVLDWTPLDPTSLEYKYYARGIGMIKEEPLGDEEIVNLIDDGS